VGTLCSRKLLFYILHGSIVVKRFNMTPLPVCCSPNSEAHSPLLSEINVRVRVRVTIRLAVHRQSVRLGAKPLETHDQQSFLTEPLQSWSLCNIITHERAGLSFTISAGPRQRSQSRVRVSWDYDHILLSQIRDFPNLEGQVPVFISPANRLVQLYTPRHWVPFSSPPSTRWATVEVFEAASTPAEINVTFYTRIYVVTYGLFLSNS
jgi:hypothetical protein